MEQEEKRELIQLRQYHYWPKVWDSLAKLELKLDESPHAKEELKNLKSFLKKVDNTTGHDERRANVQENNGETSPSTSILLSDVVTPCRDVNAPLNASAEVKQKGRDPRKRNHLRDSEDPEWIPKAGNESDLVITADHAAADLSMGSPPKILEIKRVAKFSIHVLIAEKNGINRWYRGCDVNHSNVMWIKCRDFAGCKGKFPLKILKAKMLKFYWPTPRVSKPGTRVTPKKSLKLTMDRTNKDVLDPKNYQIGSSEPHTCDGSLQGMPHLEDAESTEDKHLEDAESTEDETTDDDLDYNS